MNANIFNKLYLLSTKYLSDSSLLNTKEFISLFIDIYAKKSYSQEGEDLVLRRFFETENIQTGFYVDVGAHHPKRFSNTYYFYKKSWRGINIDATPGSMNLFKKLRPKDINLEYAIADTKTLLPYYMFTEPALNTFSKNLADQYINEGHQLLKKNIIETHPLNGILDEYLPNNTIIDLMSVDVEGFDLQVLQSNDWHKYRPTVLLVESLNFDLKKPEQCQLYIFMLKVGYRLFAKTVNTLFFHVS